MNINAEGDPEHPLQPPRRRARASMATYVENESDGGMSVDVDPDLEHKRRKARERQRRKRERDRQENAAHAAVAANAHHHHHPHHHPHAHHHNNNYDPSLVGTSLDQEQTQQSVTPTTPGLSVTPLQHSTPSLNHVASQVLVSMTPEEAARKEKIRIAARERQRKHRARTKAKRLAEASGLSPMGVEMLHHVGEGPMGVAGPPDAYHRYQEYIHSMEHVGPEPPFQVHQSPSQTFANTLLLSFSCTPLLKQHLLQSLNMSNQDLASLEPFLAAVFETWDRQRQMGPHGHPPPFLPPHHHPHQLPHFPPPGPQPNPADLHDFRPRFTRPLAGEDAFVQQQQQSEESSIDPSLSTPEQDNADAAESGGGQNGDFEDSKDDDE